MCHIQDLLIFSSDDAKNLWSRVAKTCWQCWSVGTIFLVGVNFWERRAENRAIMSRLLQLCCGGGPLFCGGMDHDLVKLWDVIDWPTPEMSLWLGQLQDGKLGFVLVVEVTGRLIFVVKFLAFRIWMQRSVCYSMSHIQYLQPSRKHVSI